MARWEILDIDPYLSDYENDINLRMDRLQEQKNRFLADGKSLKDFANAHNYYGFHKVKGGWIYREWAPNADGLYLIGDFNGWDKHSHPLHKINDEDWEIFVEGIRTIPHKSRIKVLVDANGRLSERIPLYARRVERNEDFDYAMILENPRKEFEWTDQDFEIKKDNPLIYEAHIGIAGEEGKVSSYKEFEKYILPHIVANHNHFLFLLRHYLISLT